LPDRPRDRRPCRTAVGISTPKCRPCLCRARQFCHGCVSDLRSSCLQCRSAAIRPKTPSAVIDPAGTACVRCARIEGSEALLLSPFPVRSATPGCFRGRAGGGDGLGPSELEPRRAFRAVQGPAEGRARPPGRREGVARAEPRRTRTENPFSSAPEGRAASGRPGRRPLKRLGGRQAAESLAGAHVQDVPDLPGPARP